LCITRSDEAKKRFLMPGWPKGQVRRGNVMKKRKALSLLVTGSMLFNTLVPAAAFTHRFEKQEAMELVETVENESARRELQLNISMGNIDTLEAVREAIGKLSEDITVSADFLLVDLDLMNESSSEHEIDPDPSKPAFITPADLDGDGVNELIVSKFAASSPMGSGHVDIYRMKTAGDLTGWERERLMTNVKFPNAASIHDINEDGKPDIIVPSGFLATTPVNAGAMTWFEQLDDGWKKHEITKGQKYFYHHAEIADLDGDGFKDLVTVGEHKGMFNDGSAQVHVFKGTGKGLYFEMKARKIADGLGSIPTVKDIDGDGDLDIASAEYFGSKGSFAWLENQGRLWKKRYIDASAGKSIQLSFIDDLFGDGVTRAVGANHTNTSDRPSDPESAVFVYDIPEDPRQAWPREQISEGIKSNASPPMAPQGAPGVFHWGDVDGDGDIDIVAAGDGDPRVFLLEQTAPGTFVTRVLASGLAQGGVAVADLDGDGTGEIIVSSYQNNKLLIFQSKQQDENQAPVDTTAEPGPSSEPAPENRSRSGNTGSSENDENIYFDEKHTRSTGPVVATFGSQDEFFFGLASAPGHAEDQLEDGWMRAARQGKVAAWNNQAVPEKRLEFWTKPEVELDLAQQTGISVYRLGVDWGRLVSQDPEEARVCGTVADGFRQVQDADALQRYSDIIDMVQERDMKVMLTLFHHSLPTWAIDKGGWTNPDIVNEFVEFSCDVVERMGGRVDYWIIFNEPMLFNFLSYSANMWPNHYQAWNYFRSFLAVLDFGRLYNGDMIKALNNMVEAHKQMYYKIKQIEGRAGRRAMVGTAKNMARYCPHRFGADNIITEFNKRYMTQFFLDDVAGELDFIGINYYGAEYTSGASLVLRDDVEYSESGRGVDPEGLYKTLKEVHERYNINYVGRPVRDKRTGSQLPIIITENGVSDTTDILRPAYLIEHLMAVRKAMGEGVPVKGYVFWTLCDNWEWADGYGPKFGLMAVDRENDLKRIPRMSYYLFSSIVKSGTITRDQREFAWKLVRDNVGTVRPFYRSEDGVTSLDEPRMIRIKDVDWRFQPELESNLRLVVSVEDQPSF